MTDYEIPPEVIETAAKAMCANGPSTARDGWKALSKRQREFAQHEAEAAIRAADEARGIHVEFVADKAGLIEGAIGQERLVSDWHDVEEKP